MTSTVRIGESVVGDGQPCFVIAEAGSNHDGSLEQAFALIDAAAGARADAVKFQAFRAVFSELYTPGRIFGVDELVGLLQRQPELVEINAWLNDAYYDRSDAHVERERLRYRTPRGIKEIDVAPRPGVWPYAA